MQSTRQIFRPTRRNGKGQKMMDMWVNKRKAFSFLIALNIIDFLKQTQQLLFNNTYRSKLQDSNSTKDWRRDMETNCCKVLKLFVKQYNISKQMGSARYAHCKLYATTKNKTEKEIKFYRSPFEEASTDHIHGKFEHQQNNVSTSTLIKKNPSVHIDVQKGRKRNRGEEKKVVFIEEGQLSTCRKNDRLKKNCCFANLNK